jgi:predicted amidophosphoribosyltransferase
MSFEEPEILPPEQPTLYCAECGSDAYPIGVRCSTCGKNLHDPGAMLPTNPFAPVTSKNAKPDFNFNEYLNLLQNSPTRR